MKQRDWHTDVIVHMPWMSPLPPGIKCDAIRWHSVLHRDLQNWGVGKKNPPCGIQEKSYCNHSAKWHIDFKEDMGPFFRTQNANFCAAHTMIYLNETKAEKVRLYEWLRKNHNLVNKIRFVHGLPEFEWNDHL